MTRGEARHVAPLRLYPHLSLSGVGFEVGAGAMGGPAVGNEPAEALLEVARIEPLRVAADGGGVEIGIAQVGEGGGERGHGRIGEKPAGYSVHDGFERAAARQRHDRAAGGLGLQRGEAEVFLTGEDERATPGHKLADGGVRQPTEELDRRPGGGFEPCPVAPGAHDLERHA